MDDSWAAAGLGSTRCECIDRKDRAGQGQQEREGKVVRPSAPCLPQADLPASMSPKKPEDLPITRSPAGWQGKKGPCCQV